jgi:hypothetical protein
VTTVEHRPLGLDSAVLAHAGPTAFWRVLQEERVVGALVRFDERGSGERFLYVVRNEHNQDLGIIDAGGRAYRERPHAQAEWIGTGTVVDGVAGILGLTGVVRLETTGVDELRPVAASGPGR